MSLNADQHDSVKTHELTGHLRPITESTTSTVIEGNY